jgi:hypothetical protein
LNEEKWRLFWSSMFFYSLQSSQFIRIMVQHFRIVQSG